MIKFAFLSIFQFPIILTWPIQGRNWGFLGVSNKGVTLGPIKSNQRSIFCASSHDPQLKKIEKSEKGGFFALFWPFLGFFGGIFRGFLGFINDPLIFLDTLIPLIKSDKNIDFY